jgi:glycosyltransferase involved in cell wall biosynthesis
MHPRKFIQIVSNLASNQTYKEDYFTWPAAMMKEKGFEPEILTTQKGEPRETVRGITVKRFKSPFSLLFYAFRQDAFIHSHLRPYLPSLLSALLPKKKLITPFTYELGSNPLIQAGSLFLLRRFDRVIAISPYEEELYLKHGFARNRVFFIPLAIDYDLFSKARKDPKIAAKAGIKPGYTIITVANFRYFKRVDILLKAFRELKSKVSDAQLVIVGEDRLASEHRQTISEMVQEMQLRDVLLLGTQEAETICKILKFADVFVNTSSVESQCIAAYEASASGLPLCLSDIPSFTYVFKDHALYHKYDDPSQLAQNLLQYHKDKKLASKNASYVKELVKDWDYELVKKKLWSVYSELLQLR